MRNLIRATVCVLGLLSATDAAGYTVTKDIAYRVAELPSEQKFNMLDIYAPEAARDLPVVVYIHGGGWEAGDKSFVYAQPQLFTDNQMMYISLNHRLTWSGARTPYIFPTHANDVADALAWIRANIGGYGGNPQAIVVTGHSSGAHLSAIVSVDSRYLGARGLGLDAIKGAILLDGGDYDFKARHPTLSEAGLASFNLVLGTHMPASNWDDGTPEDIQAWLNASPIQYVTPTSLLPPMLFIKAGSRADLQDENMAESVAKNPANDATVWVAQGKNHNAVNRDLGKPGDAMNDVVISFVQRTLARDGGTMPVDAGSAPPPPDASVGDSGPVNGIDSALPPATPPDATAAETGIDPAATPGQTTSPSCSAASTPRAAHDRTTWWWFTALSLLAWPALRRRRRA